MTPADGTLRLMRHASSIALIAAIACAGQQDTTRSTPATTVTSLPLEPLLQTFTFHEQQLPCDAVGKPLQNFCVAAVPSRWSESEKSKILNILARLGARSPVRTVLSDVVSAGYGRFFKFQHGFETDNGIYFIRRDRVNAWVGAPDSAISVNQRFVDVRFAADPVGGFDPHEVRLLHEMFHVLDRVRHYSITPAFRIAADDALSSVDRKQCSAIRDQFVAESNNGRDNEAWARMRTALQSLPTTTRGRHLPGVAVCLGTDDNSYQEAFADYAAYWLIDPTATSYFPEAIAQWLRAALK